MSVERCQYIGPYLECNPKRWKAKGRIERQLEAAERIGHALFCPIAKKLHIWIPNSDFDGFVERVEGHVETYHPVNIGDIITECGMLESSFSEQIEILNNEYDEDMCCIKWGVVQYYM
jgi:hypothetical protein